MTSLVSNTIISRPTIQIDITKKGSVVNKATVRVWLTVNIVDSMQSILEALIHPDPVTLSTTLVPSNRLIHLSLFVNIRQLILPQRLPLALTLIFGLTDQRNPVSLSILSTYLVIPNI